MATSLINREFEKLRAHVESVKMPEEEKNNFFQNEWNRICEKEKDRQAILPAERETLKPEREKSKIRTLRERERLRIGTRRNRI